MDAKSIQQILDEQRKQSELFKKSNHQIQTIIANKEKATNPEWLEANKKASDRRWATSEHRAKINAANKAKAKDPNWRESNQKGSDKRWATEGHRQKVDAANKAKAKDPNWLKAVAESNAAKARFQVTPQGVFKSSRDAIAASGVNKNKFRELKKLFPDLYFNITREQYIEMIGK
jgi:hypothetical protein